MLQRCSQIARGTQTQCPSVSIFFVWHEHSLQFLKESTLTYITMLINRTFPFCRPPQRATLASLWLSHHTAWAPFMFFPCCNLLTELGFDQKSVSVPIIIWQGREAV